MWNSKTKDLAVVKKGFYYKYGSLVMWKKPLVTPKGNK